MSPVDSQGGEARCTCDVKPPRHTHGYGNSMGGYSIYMSFIEDDTRFDPGCSFHGDAGTMVVKVRA